MGEDGFVEGDTQAATVDRDSIQKEIREIMNKPEFLYAHKPGHDELVKRYRELYEMLHPREDNG